MAKTQEELNRLKKDYEELAEKLKGLSEEELEYIAAGAGSAFDVPEKDPSYDPHFYHNDVKKNF